MNSRPRARCSVSFHEVHFFYDKLCPRCAGLNWTQRNLSRDLAGKTALVTGGRIKIGYQIALKLLRCGATLVVSNHRTAAESGSGVWQAGKALAFERSHAVRDCDPSSRRVAASSNLVGTGVRLAP